MARRLGDGEVHAFYAFVDAVTPEDARAQLLPLLDDDERERHRRFHFDTHRHLYLVAHALCRNVLSRYTGIAATELRFEASPQGKPVLTTRGGEPSLCFNLSHTGGLAAVALARAEIGVDVERIDRRVELEAVARRVFSEAELAGILACQGDARRRRFFEHWTLKEAYVKALGDGLTAPLRQITIDAGAGGQARLVSAPDAGPTWLHGAAPSDEHLLALALRSAPPSALHLEAWTFP